MGSVQDLDSAGEEVASLGRASVGQRMLAQVQRVINVHVSDLREEISHVKRTSAEPKLMTGKRGKGGPGFQRNDALP